MNAGILEALSHIVDAAVATYGNDTVETLVGGFTGNFGAVMSEKPTNGKWQVVFSEFYTGKDIADIMVNEEDLKVYDSVPKDKYPVRK